MKNQSADHQPHGANPRRIKSNKNTSYFCLILFLLALPLAGCGADDAPAPTPTPTTAPAPAAPPAATATPAPTAVVVPPGSFVNPVFRQDFADPHILQDGDTFYGFATNSLSRNIMMARSTDLVNWELLTDAMPALPKWAQLGGSYVWAPEVMKIGDKYVMYYTARDKEIDRQCIGVATSDKPEGKYRDTNDKALICPADQGGAIDANPFRDGDKLYLYWKNDGNCCGQATWLYGQEMSPDGLTLTTEPVQLIRNEMAWEGAVTEGPTMWKHADKYYLFYSANNYAGLEYAVGYAVCDTPLGPCTKGAENPILKTSLERPPVIGPGGQALLQIGDQTWIAYHAWEVSSAGLKTARRFMWLDRLDWVDGKPVVRGPTTAPQPKPAVNGG
jgi:GH43 family beta-xylosidase